MLRKHQAPPGLSQREKSPLCRGMWGLVHEQDLSCIPTSLGGKIMELCHHPWILKSVFSAPDTPVLSRTALEGIQVCSSGRLSHFLNTPSLDNTDEAVRFYPLFSSFQCHPCRLYTQVFQFFSHENILHFLFKTRKKNNTKTLKNPKLTLL